MVQYIRTPVTKSVIKQEHINLTNMQVLRLTCSFLLFDYELYSLTGNEPAQHNFKPALEEYVADQKGAD